MEEKMITNKEKLKSAMNEDINPKVYYNEIIKKIEKKEERRKKNNMWKWSLAPICLVAIMGGLLFINPKNNSIILETHMDKENNIKLNINDLTNVGAGRLDVDVKVVTNNAVNFPLPYKNGRVDIPKDLDKISKYIFYLKENKESKEYNILGNYEIIYDNGNDRTIKVSYSKDNKPVRDYFFSDEGSKTTTINDINLTIYKYNTIYFTEFNYNGYNFDMETNNISEQELSNLLISIIK